MAKVEKIDADDAGDDEGDNKAAPASRFPSKKILIIGVVVLALVGVSVGGAMLFTDLFGKSERVKVKKAGKKVTDAAEGEEAGVEEKEGEQAKAEGETEGEGEGEEEGDTNPDGTPRVAMYMDFEQPFVVNFQDEGQLRYLQITISVMTKNPKVVEEMKRHMPLIRNNLVMLFSGQTREGIISREGKEKIRKEAEAEVQKILKEQTGNSGVKALYFTSFVMQ